MINQKHFLEWLESGVHPDLIKLNVISLEGQTPHQYLLYGLPQSERRNDGRLRDKWLKKYHHVENGGWWCWGVDILNPAQENLWGCFKPDSPRSYQEGSKQKTIKYEHPPKVATEIFKLGITWEIGLKIAQRAGLEENYLQRWDGFDLTKADPEFWEWVKSHPDIPIIITEGAKKAGALLTLGYVAIALPGVTGAVRTPKDSHGNKIGNPYLIPQIKAFCQEGRQFFICFDQDTKPKTVKNVNREIDKLGFLLNKEKCSTSIITWDLPYKGVDDLIVNIGKERFNTEIFTSAQTYAHWQLNQNLDLTPQVSIEINQRYCDFDIPEAEKIIGIKSPKDTGKTELLSKYVKHFTSSGKKRILVITHRVQLCLALSQRFGLEYVTEIWQENSTNILGFTLCVDSVHPNSQARFNPSDWEDAVIIIDEAEQVLWHTLNSQTCQTKRVKIIETLREVIKVALSTNGQLILADADLSPISLNYFTKIANYEGKPYVIQNTYQKETKKILYNYEGKNPSAIWKEIVRQIKMGKTKHLIHTSGQRYNSKWGTQTLEKKLRKEFPHLRTLRIDSESVVQPGHPAFGCMVDLNKLLQNYDIIIVSPVIETGVSIDLKGYFDGDWCISWGVQTVDSICQQMERLRDDDCPRYLWASEKGLNSLKVGRGETKVKQLLASQHKNFEDNLKALKQIGVNDFDDLETPYNPELIAWAQRACVINHGYWNYRKIIIDKLKSEGYEIVSESALCKEESKAITEAFTKIRDEQTKEYREKVSQAEDLTPAELKALQKNQIKSPEDRQKQRKGEIKKRYGLDVTSELIEKDDKGFYQKLRLHYYLTIGKNHLPARERKALLKLQEGTTGKGFKPDVNKRSLAAKIWALELLYIKDLLDPDFEFTNESLSDWYAHVSQFKQHIKRLYGISLRNTPIQCANQFLGLLDLKLSKVRQNSDGTRVYQFMLSEDNRCAIFDYWYELEQRELEALGINTVTPSPNKINIDSGVTELGVTSTEVGSFAVTPSPNNIDTDSGVKDLGVTSTENVERLFEEAESAADYFRTIIKMGLESGKEALKLVLDTWKAHLEGFEEILEIAYWGRLVAWEKQALKEMGLGDYITL